MLPFLRPPLKGGGVTNDGGIGGGVVGFAVLLGTALGFGCSGALSGSGRLSSDSATDWPLSGCSSAKPLLSIPACRKNSFYSLVYRKFSGEVELLQIATDVFAEHGVTQSKFNVGLQIAKLIAAVVVASVLNQHAVDGFAFC